MTQEGKTHRVRQGESTTQLAFENGLFWETVWNHEKNQSLRELRKRPNVLLAGDEIFIPALTMKTETRATDQSHRFIRKGVPEVLRMRFLDFDGKPLADTPFTLTIEGVETTGTLDYDGWLVQPIPPNASQGRLEIGDGGGLLTTELRLGELDPVSELSGVQARLYNIGYYGGPIDGEDSDELRAAVQRFREDAELSAGGGVDDDLRAKLEEHHMC